MPRNPTTPEEALAVLRNSSLPTVVTEGRDDYQTLRRLEERLDDLGVDFLPLCGKDSVLRVFEELPDHRRTNTLLLVDLDHWMYFGIPPKYQSKNLLYTFGYSIENDLILDYDLTLLLTRNEKENFLSEVNLVAASHSIEIERARPDKNCSISRHPSDILKETFELDMLEPSEVEMHAVLVANYKQIMRGKTVFQLLIRQLTAKNRKVKFGFRQLLEIAAANTGTVFDSLETEIRLRLSSF